MRPGKLYSGGRDLLAVKEAHLGTEGAEFASHFLLHEIEAHGEECEADEQIERTEHHPSLRVVVKASPTFSLDPRSLWNTNRKP